jgi:L-iditol 2-dehydrogenase
MARALGADHALDIDRIAPDDRPAAVRELTSGRGSDVTIECTGEPCAVREGLRMTRGAGVYVVVGQYTDAGEVTLNPHWDLNRKHLDVRACWGIDLSHLYRAVNVLARHRDHLPWREVVSAEYPLARAAQALSDVGARRVVKAVINPHA